MRKPTPAQTERQARLAQLHEEVRKLETEEIEEIRARRAAVKPVWQFQLERIDVANSWDRVREGCGVDIYRLRGTVLNREECEAAGQDGSKLGGAMNYYFNTLCGKFIKSTGSGHAFIAAQSYGTVEQQRESIEDAELVFRALEAFLAEHPKGGDVTDIVRRQRHNGWF